MKGACYSIRVRCSNCLHEERLTIPCGETVSERECPVCGCQTLRRAPLAMPGVRA